MRSPTDPQQAHGSPLLATHLLVIRWVGQRRTMCVLGQEASSRYARGEARCDGHRNPPGRKGLNHACVRMLAEVRCGARSAPVTCPQTRSRRCSCRGETASRNTHARRVHAAESVPSQTPPREMQCAPALRVTRTLLATYVSRSSLTAHLCGVSRDNVRALPITSNVFLTCHGTTHAVFATFGSHGWYSRGKPVQL